jgi:hypothetical protein
LGRSNARKIRNRPTQWRGRGMKVKVTLYVGGKVFDEALEARDYQDTKQIALARNPTTKAISITDSF